MTNKIFSALKVVTLAIVLSFGLSYVYAWTAPATNPPTGNVSAPINTGADLQSKGGGLTVKNFIADTVTVGATPNTGAISSPKFCIGTSCITAWTQAGAVTKLTAGTNITLSPVGGTGNVTVNAVGGTLVYSCPAAGTCGNDTCKGNLSLSSSCTTFSYNSDSRTACALAVPRACTLVGKLLP